MKDIEKHEWFDGTLEIKSVTDLGFSLDVEGLSWIFIDKSDAIAIAKHFKLIDSEVIE